MEQFLSVKYFGRPRLTSLLQFTALCITTGQPTVEYLYEYWTYNVLSEISGWRATGARHNKGKPIM